MVLHHISTRNGQLSSFLRGELAMSSGLMNKLKWGDAIQVNGVPQRTNYPVKPGDVITVRVEEPEPEYPAEEGALTILYEDDWIIVVDKPQGMLIHPSRSRFTGTLANFVLGHYQKNGHRGAFHPLTRLDRDTYGIVLAGKDPHTCTRLQSSPIRKTYHAITFGGPAEDTGIIDAPISRLPLPSLLRQVSPEGKPSVTEFSVLERRKSLTKLALHPVTGRTHQLRVHCAYRGYPILGDPQYGSEDSMALSQSLNLSGQLLCAYSLAFTHPVTGEALYLTSKMDADFPQ